MEHICLLINLLLLMGHDSFMGQEHLCWPALATGVLKMCAERSWGDRSKTNMKVKELFDWNISHTTWTHTHE